MKFAELIRKIKKNEDYSYPYHDLAPADDISEESEYFRALDWALQNKKISNIALSAPYGAGKSSVIESYIKARKIKALQLSLANFNEIKDSSEPEKVEKEFLKKLFYKAEYKQIPQSRYRKLHKIYAGRIYGYLWALAIICLELMIAFNMTGLKEILMKLDETRNQLALSLPIGVVMMLILVSVMLLVLSLVFKWTLSKWENLEITVFDKAKFSKAKDTTESTFKKQNLQPGIRNICR